MHCFLNERKRFQTHRGRCQNKTEKEQEEFLMAAFLGSFMEYVLKAIVYAVLALLGVKAGKALRENKDAKNTSTVRINNTGRR